MRKLLPFEISVAIKDRPKSFQFITLAMFSFCITVILIGTILRLVSPVDQRKVVNKQPSASYAGLTTVSTFYGVQR